MPLPALSNMTFSQLDTLTLVKLRILESALLVRRIQEQTKRTAWCLSTSFGRGTFLLPKRVKAHSRAHF